MGRITRFLRASVHESAEVGRPDRALMNDNDRDLQRVIACWPTVPKHIRSAILALIVSSRAGRPGISPRDSQNELASRRA